MSPAAGRRIKLAIAAGLVLIAIWEIVWARRASTHVPDDAAWREAAAVVRTEVQPGDLIVFAPAWIDPVGRMHLGDLIPVDMAARASDRGYTRIWELSIRGASVIAGRPVELDREVAGIRIRRYRGPGQTRLADTRALVPRFEGGAGSVVLAEVGFAPRRCLQVTPPPNGKPVRVTFAELPAGTLGVSVGLADVFKRRTYRKPATLAVEVGGKVVASARPGIDTGWTALPDVPFAGGAVTFVISADQPERLVCFAAEVWQ